MLQDNYTDFKDISNSCSQCFYNYEKQLDEKSIEFKALVQEGLRKIILLSNETNMDIATESLNACKNCDYHDTKVKDIIESYHIKSN